MELSFIFIAAGLFILGVMVYVGLMVFFPEWVGITGKKALEAEQSHTGDRGAARGSDSGPASDVLQRMEKVPTDRTSAKKE